MIFPLNPWLSAGRGGERRSGHRAALLPPSKFYMDLYFQVHVEHGAGGQEAGDFAFVVLWCRTLATIGDNRERLFRDSIIFAWQILTLHHGYTSKRVWTLRLHFSNFETSFPNSAGDFAFYFP